MAKKPVQDPDLAAFAALPNDDARNRRLLAWLSDERQRALLFEKVNGGSGHFDFPSRDDGQREPDNLGLAQSRPAPAVGYTSVRLVTKRSEIEQVLRNACCYSNRIYAELGGGSFMLALDPAQAKAHAAQREAFKECFPHDQTKLVALAHLACQSAAVTALRSPEFDLADYADQSALRFCQMLLGYSIADYGLLASTLRAAYRALVHQVLGRHFVTDPVVIPAGRQALGRLLARTSSLIDAYAEGDEDALKGTHDRSLGLLGLEPVMSCLGLYPRGLHGEQRAVLVVGAAVGTVGNVQAAACIGVEALFADPVLWEQARQLAREEPAHHPTTRFEKWKALIATPLRLNPPIPFLPRLEVANDGSVKEVLLALGGGTRDQPAPSGDDPLVWGLPGEPGAAAPHWCAGQGLAWPLVIEIIRQVMRLPGLAERLDPQDASVIGLKKRWGFACESYPLTHRRDCRVAQSSLNVAMRLKSPVRDSADRVREVLRAGAPRIEQALRESMHVHFAWFELIEGDSVLVLHTVYDGPFAAYVQDFALKVGDLFDLLFSCMEDPPPLPVDQFPEAFVAHIQRYDRAPLMGYFFSAYPQGEVARILRNEWARP